MKNIDLKTYIEKHTDLLVRKIDDTGSALLFIYLERHCIVDGSDKVLDNTCISYSYSTNCITGVISDFISFANLKLLNSLLKKYYKNKMKEGE